MKYITICHRDSFGAPTSLKKSLCVKPSHYTLQEKRLLATKNLVAKRLILVVKSYLQPNNSVTIWLLNVGN